MLRESLTNHAGLAYRPWHLLIVGTNFTIPFGKLYFLIIYLDYVVIIWRPLYLLLNSILYKVINKTRTPSKLFKVVARDLLSCVWVNMYVSNVATIIWSIKLPDSFQETSWNHFVIKLSQQTIDIYDIWPLSMIAFVVIGHMPKIQLIPGHMQIISLWQPTYFQQDYERNFWSPCNDKHTPSGNSDEWRIDLHPCNTFALLMLACQEGSLHKCRLASFPSSSRLLSQALVLVRQAAQVPEDSLSSCPPVK